MGTAGEIRVLLIANRGEIACRIARTCRRLGVRTVAVYSNADARSLHVAECDIAVALPGDAPADTYLRVDLLIDAARRSGADAVHPGYGFLAEHAGFAHAVLDAGLIWVGPPPEAIAAMGSKVEAKARMRAAGVPVLADSTVEGIDAIGLPILVKASAGGGGRGMRIVRSATELDEALATAEREAASAVGDGTVFCERYVEKGRHIEVQVFADTHGTTTALFERECSIQRRHQKIVEEAPSPAVDPALRHRLCEAAVAAARDVGYIGAGTVEFLVDEQGEPAFLEMNTRLQVEHPVTEMVTGLDLVELQLLVAEGHPLPQQVLHAALTGHAIEVRLTAEDPSAGYLPATGVFHRFEIGHDGSDDGLRIDTGVSTGSVVSPHYDSMVAKVIVHASTRAAALRRMSEVLRTARLHGPVTNLDQLRTIIDHPEFAAGRIYTSFLDDHPCIPVGSPDPGSFVAASTAIQAHRRTGVPVLGSIAPRWRNNPATDRAVAFTHGSQIVTVRSPAARPSTGHPARFEIDTATADGTTATLELAASVTRAGPDHVVLNIDGLMTSYSVHIVPDDPNADDRNTGGDTRSDPVADPGHRLGDTAGATVYVDGPDGTVKLRLVPRFTAPGDAAVAGSLVAPMPGAIRRVHVAVGEAVAAGQTLVSLEAMKMEHQVIAPAAGTVAEVLVAAGDQVDTGQTLLRLDEQDHNGAAS